MRHLVPITSLALILAACASPSSSKPGPPPVKQVMPLTQDNLVSTPIAQFARNTSDRSHPTAWANPRAITVSAPAGTVYYLLTNVSTTGSGLVKLGGVDGSTAPSRQLRSAAPAML